MEGAHDGNFLGWGTGAEQEARAILKGGWEENLQRIASKQVGACTKLLVLQRVCMIHIKAVPGFVPNHKFLGVASKE